ncbi:MAG: SOS response-associated peptidase [Aromatoleum sp.]|jgi:putative SOS response-associated peptidase YedK|uniref:SOS response-associated peptidase n=1 Tax=Aromatoleum sp. TaxID=2307007 RepID=UPI002893A93C|nr:SOS response-associated peptidase [Aromatoleum sp.]MDT3668948.1 SOS response-associated peptidase [Aromatoleum sp.]
MCGRYALYGPLSGARRQFEISLDEQEIIPRNAPNPFAWGEDRYNVAPSQLSPVIRTVGDHREIITARWGLLPHWVKEPGRLARPINAKVETAAYKPMFRSAFRQSRVLIPASGFYEWQPLRGGKQPYFIRPIGGETLFGFGGLLERWTGPEGEVRTFAILTTAANDIMRPIHDRMPVIVQPKDYAAWLDPHLTDADLVRELADEFPPGLMRAHPVNRAIGNPRSQGPQLVEPAEDI